MKKIVIVTGGFDPLHSGHIEYFNAAKSLGNHLIVGLNSDEWLIRKKGRPFMTWNERASIIKELRMVDDVISFDDSDGSAKLAIYKCLQMFPDEKIIFANGGDRTNDNIPELIYEKTPRVKFEFGVGGSNKKNSSSWILDEWKTQKTNRDWGYWRVLDDKGIVKVKELVINPHSSLSDQRHFHRGEHWYILEGQCQVDLDDGREKETVNLNAHEKLIIETGIWHRAYNITDKPCHILEVQHGEKCVEDDIIRR